MVENELQFRFSRQERTTVYGKAYESMYDGSMIGAGLHVFAVWNYVIAKARYGTVELNPRLLAMLLGGSEDAVIAAIVFLCKPDPNSRSKEEGGRRLVREGQFLYRVVNWAKYHKTRTEAERREYQRIKQREYRAKRKASRNIFTSGPLPGETVYQKALVAGASKEQLDRMSDPASTRD